MKFNMYRAHACSIHKTVQFQIIIIRLNNVMILPLGGEGRGGEGRVGEGRVGERMGRGEDG